ncbi:MAG: SAM-dependent methyltransferase [Flavobacteriaceae bacterium]|nr:MAG: SAM-dependent methyltransferase [Flavobacteriaceae bacterium]
MNKLLLHTGVQEYIKNNLNTDIVSVLLKRSPFEGISSKELAQQIEAKKKCENKLVTWYSNPQIYYPNKLNIEQTSSQVTAKYKSQLVDGKSLLDITGGFGVDSYFFAQKIETVYHCEIDKNLSEIAAYNFRILDVKNVTTIAQNGVDFLKNSKHNFDWVFIDPSRRSEAKGKVFFLTDCLPNVPEHLDEIFKKTNKVCIKTSPLLDFSIGIKELQFVKEIHVIAVSNEVKELLWVLEKNYSGETSIKTINLKKSKNEYFNFRLDKEKATISNYAQPSIFLYEPNAAILKSGAFKIIGNYFGLKKLHEHTHLYTSSELVDFPGRSFKIIQLIPFHKKTIRKLGIAKANITIRNFPESVAEIRKRFDIKEGGEVYLFFTKNNDGEKMLIRCSKTN